MRRMILVVMLGALAVGSSGCASVLGAIIGYQSGELCAGLAIGALVDTFSGEIDRAGKNAATAADAVTVYSEMGYIRVDKKCGDGKKVEEGLQEKMTAMTWQCGEPNETEEGQVSKRTYSCRTQQGRAFDLEFFREKCEDLRIYVRLPEADDELRGLITSQLGIWASEAVK